jgi:PAS domain S-box-containing protein
VQINSALALDSLLQTITDQARSIIGARQAFTTLLPKGAWHRSLTSVSVAEGEERIAFPQESSEAFMLACRLNKPLRLPAGNRSPRPLQTMINNDAVRHGWLAAPLVTRDGRNLGLIQLSQKLNGDFSEDDEAILVQLAHMASVAIDNVRLYHEAQDQIAETRRAQEALERSKESMQLAQQHVGVGIWEWDLQSGALEWSEEIRRLHGMGVEGFDGKYESWMESIHQEDRDRVHRSITDAIARSAEYEVQYRAVFPDRSVHWLEARGRTIVIGGRPVRILGVAMDVTSRKLAEDTLRGSEKLAATGRLAASMAHEINNPLAAVTNALYILRTNPQLPKTALEYVKTAEAELARVVHITKQTLGFYRHIASPMLTSIPQLLDETLAAYGNEIEKSNVVIRRVYAEVAPIPVFPAELRQAFSNVVLNAVEAMNASGKIVIHVKQIQAGDEAKGIQISVLDDGPGIPQENMPHLFEPFFSTKGNRGTGLGLWVSQGIVQKHGGRIRVRTSTGENHHGTCCVVFLPFLHVQEQAATAAAAREVNGSEPAAGKSESAA